MMSRLILLIGATILLFDKSLAQSSPTALLNITNSTMMATPSLYTAMHTSTNVTTTVLPTTYVGGNSIKASYTSETTTAASSKNSSVGETTTKSSSVGENTTKSSSVEKTTTKSPSGGSAETTAKSSSGGSAETTAKSSSGGSAEATTKSSSGESVDGKWNDWTNWVCAKCGAGNKTRIRTCTNPPPSGGGKDCTGSSKVDGDICKPCAKESVIIVVIVQAINYNDDMKDTNSQIYLDICGPLIKFFKDQFGIVVQCTIIKGSVKMVLNVTIDYGKKVGNSSSSPLNLTALVLETVKEIKIVNLTFDLSSITVKVVVSGLKLGEWGFGDKVCDECCADKKPDSTLVWKNRTCEELTASCTGAFVSVKLPCKDTSCDLTEACPEKDIKKDSGNNGLFSSMALVLLAFLSIGMFV